MRCGVGRGLDRARIPRVRGAQPGRIRRLPGRQGPGPRHRTDAEARVEESRARLTKLQEDLPTQFGELRDRLTNDELRKVAESYAEAAQTRYNNLVERGEAALERLRSTNALEEGRERVERYSDQAVELTQEALGNVASQTRAVGQPATKLVGVELPMKAQKAAPAKKAPAKKAPAKKATAKRATRK